ncbi:MAG: endonuclease/exonuclease/phosphatase [Acidobacteria bacterium]|nr:endonuclease/exonuclease/phosphatase [Acidobacteriota bacterium]
MWPSPVQVERQLGQRELSGTALAPSQPSITKWLRRKHVPTIVFAPRHIWPALMLVGILGGAPPVAAAELTAMTLNTKHGGQAPWRTKDQIAEIVAEAPDIVLLQEADSSQLDDYVNGINRGLQSVDWHGEYARHCYAGTPPDCSNATGEAVMILTRLPITGVEKRLIWAADEYVAARGVLRVTVRLDDGTALQIFACHLPAAEAARDARITWVADFLPWARTMAGPRLVGGDFNDDPSSPPIAALRHEYIDAWGSKGSGNGGTHSHDGEHYGSRIDYLWSAGGLVPTKAFVPQVALSDHRPVVATYAVNAGASSNDGDAPVPTPAPVSNPVSRPVSAPVVVTPPVLPVSAGFDAGESVLLEDTFDTAIVDRTKWAGGLFSGYQDMRLPVTADGGALQIVPLTSVGGISHYNGVSAGAFDLSGGGYASVQLVQGPIGEGAYAMFTVGADAMHFYRIYQGGAAQARVLLIQKKIDGVKMPLAAVAYDVVAHQVLRVRHDRRPSESIDDAVFEASPSPATATSFVELFREPWDPAVASAALMFELKAGTSAPETQPGTVIWDNFRVAAVSAP